MEAKSFVTLLFLSMVLVVIFACAGGGGGAPAPTLTPTPEEAFSYYISEINEIDSELTEELQKLPDFERIDAEDVEAIEDIFELAQRESFFGTSFDAMLEEGIEADRKYCSPLQALVWLCYDYENEFLDTQPWEECAYVGAVATHLKLTHYAWRESSASNNYESKRWENFDEVVDRLNAPRLFEIYMWDNLSYSYVYGEPEGVKSAEQIFTAKYGACYDIALYAGYCLKGNGYNGVQGLVVRFQRPYEGYFGGHVACLFQDPKDSQYYTVDFGSVGGWVFGPFQSIEEAAKHSCFGQGLKSYSLHDIDLQTGKYETTWR